MFLFLWIIISNWCIWLTLEFFGLHSITNRIYVEIWIENLIKYLHKSHKFSKSYFIKATFIIKCVVNKKTANSSKQQQQKYHLEMIHQQNHKSIAIFCCSINIFNFIKLFAKEHKKNKRMNERQARNIIFLLTNLMTHILPISRNTKQQIIHSNLSLVSVVGC